MTDKISEEDIIFNSLGILDEDRKDFFKSKIKSSSENEIKLAAEFNNLTALITRIVFADKIKTPPASIKDKILSKIKSNNIPEDDSKVKNFEFIFTNTGEWMPHPEIKGMDVKPLALNKEKGYLMILMRAVAGCLYPSHHHSGAEECYVLEGDLYVEGKTLGPGDFHHAEGGSDHEPLSTKNGCTLLLVVDPKDY